MKLQKFKGLSKKILKYHYIRQVSNLLLQVEMEIIILDSPFDSCTCCVMIFG